MIGERERKKERDKNRKRESQLLVLPLISSAETILNKKQNKLNSFFLLNY